MKINTIEINGENIAKLVSDEIELSKAQDAVDLMGSIIENNMIL